MVPPATPPHLAQLQQRQPAVGLCRIVAAATGPPSNRLPSGAPVAAASRGWGVPAERPIPASPAPPRAAYLVDAEAGAPPHEELVLSPGR